MPINLSTSNLFVNTFTEKDYKKLYIASLPYQPYCTDFLGSLSHRPALEAQRYNYVQHNPVNSITWLVYDIDSSLAYFTFEDTHSPCPSIMVINPTNGHGHYFYALETPVHKNYDSKDAPIKYAASIDSALCKKLGADPSYSGFISKNPLVSKWLTYFFNDCLYDLAWLSGYFTSLPNVQKIEPAECYGIGRNCSLFDMVRLWAYKEIRDTAYNNNSYSFFKAVFNHSSDLNKKSFITPLFENEVSHIAKSVSSWVFKNMSPMEFKKWGDDRRKASAITRQQKARETAAQVIQFAADNPTFSYRRIAREIGLDEKSIRNILKNTFFSK